MSQQPRGCYKSKCSRLYEPERISTFVSGEVRGELVGTSWEGRLRRIDVQPTSQRLAQIELYRLG